ncbi:synaptotagmin 2 [Pelobates cultripes]|uniref:Synaptotagmin-like protein 2 n=1 Tax=Pelobates cultripes TaxID=61616 RepID=A0AAD1WKR0_PELCU|nr:synaptotagmin 2 [Pelobates cultripes]
MKNSTGTTLDLSFLTDEEYEKLIDVLHRDAELQRKESDRLSRLQGSLKDEKKKKFVTGAWFHDIKSKRFQEDLQGPELLRASIRKKKNPANYEDHGTAGATKERKTNLFSKPVVDKRDTNVSNSDTEIFTSTVQLQSKSSFVQEPSEKGRNIAKTSPVDSVDGLNEGDSNLAAAMSGPLKNARSNHLPHATTDLQQYDDSDPKDALPNNVTSKPPVPEKQSPKEDINILSKIPVKRKPSKESKRPTIAQYFDQPESSTKKMDVSIYSNISSPDTEIAKEFTTNANFTIQSLKDKNEQESIVDREQFKSLKTFWEKGADVSADAQSNSEAELAIKGSPDQSVKPNKLIPVQSNRKQTSDEKIEHPHRVKHVSQRAPVVSSSEDEVIHVPHPRKGSSSLIPRSTYGKSKGSPNSRTLSLSENGTSSQSEESSGVIRASKRSKLPVRAPSFNKEEKAGSLPSQRVDEQLDIPMSEVEEFIVPDKKPEVNESLHSRVKILIDAVSSDEERDTGDAEPKTNDKMESISSENAGSIDEYSESISESQASVVSNAKSMVNIYTTSETYNKPQISNLQLLEPERSKDLSKSTPTLLSETESDTASEISFNLKRHRKTHSSGSNSSDMASVSSVSNSVLSVYSGDFGSVDAQGSVEFSLDYDEKNREFQIFVSQCRDLAVVDEKKGRSDPYVKTYLLPDKARMGKRKTAVKRKTTNPVYNEVLRYKIDKMVLLIQKLNLSVWHNDPLGRNSFLGEMEVDLTSWDWSNTKPNWYPLKSRSLSAMNGVDHLGVMNLAIRYVPPGSLGPKVPNTGEVHIWVKDTKDLPQLRPSGVDSFVKCYVLPDTSKKSYQKTRVIKKDSNPIFNHTIVYDGFHTEDLKDACVELTVWDHEKLSNHFLGGIRLGVGTGYSYGIAVDWMDSTQEEVAFWQEMMATPNEWIEGSFPLRSLAGRRKFK